MIKVENMSKSFGQITALKNVSFEVQKGDIFGLVGPDGAGKTTLIRTICGLMRPDLGSVHISEGVYGTGRFGYMPQKFSLYGDLSITENILLFGGLYGLSEELIKERGDRILEMTGMLDYKNRHADKLSGGMRQKLAITTALITQPELLILDEPTYGIDPVSRYEIWKLLQELNKNGMTILVSTPYMNEATLCKKLVYIENGVMGFAGTPEDFKQSYPDMFYDASQDLHKKTNIREPENDFAITTSGLTRIFGGFTAVDQVDIKVPKGKIYGFLGPNGAGKTTLIKMLCGLLEPSAGSATILGLDLKSKGEAIKQKIGYMSQKYSLYDDLTATENLDFFAGIYGMPKGAIRTERINEVLEMAGLEGREKDLAATLSPGLKQRLALGSAILSKPELLFLDEPTSGVSPITRKAFFEVIANLAEQGTTVIVTTHFMDEAERCDELMFLLDGRLIAQDTPLNLKKSLISVKNPNVSLDDVFVALSKTTKQEDRQ
jgi:ABC-2 type transport system ATP-binding protein